jgi:hypothetical protein
VVAICCIILLNIKIQQVKVRSYEGNVALAIEKSVRVYCVMTEWWYHWECGNTTASNLDLSKPWYCVPWVPCHYGMARPQVADGGGDLQIWRVAVNILNKQSRTADKGWPSSLGVGWGANNSPL